MSQNNKEVKFSYETLWKFIIRPERDNYTDNKLGSPNFKFKGKKYHRLDYEIKSGEGYKLKCSFIEPLKEYRPSEIMPVIVYLHGNSSSRLEGLYLAKEILKRNINLFVFDFAGCGQSEGEFISLGYYESKDLRIIIDFIKKKIPGTGKIGLFGRSMGAATTMIYAHRDKRVEAICVDSPFADFEQLARELTLKQVKLPGFIITIALSFVKSTIINKNGLDIDKLKPIDQAKKTKQPVFFVHAINDELIHIHHSVELYDAYAGKDKTMRYIEEGGHNSRRPEQIRKEIFDFFEKHLIGKKSKIENKNKNIDKNHKENEEDFQINELKNKEYFEKREKIAQSSLKEFQTLSN